MIWAAPVGGYAGLGFSASKGRMVPADAVIRYVDAATLTTKGRFAVAMGEGGGLYAPDQLQHDSFGYQL
jgi:hypothetical protein